MHTTVQPVTQLKVCDRHFLLMNEPDLVGAWSSPVTTLEMVASAAGSTGEESVFMTPQAAPFTRLIEHKKSDNRLELRHWMEYDVALKHMKDFILRCQKGGLPSTLSREQLDAFDVDKLYAVFSAMSKRTRRG